MGSRRHTAKIQRKLQDNRKWHTQETPQENEEEALIYADGANLLINKQSKPNDKKATIPRHNKIKTTNNTMARSRITHIKQNNPHAHIQKHSTK